MSCLLGNVRVGADSPLQVQLYNADDGTPVDISTFDSSWTANGKHATSLVDTAFTGVSVISASEGKLNLEMDTNTFSAGVYDVTITGYETTLGKTHIFPYEQETFKMRVA